MQLPSKVTYQGQVYAVLGYAGKKYRLSNGTFAPMTQCVEHIEPAEGDVMFIDTSKVEVPTMQPLEPVKLEDPKSRRGGRPRKIKAAE